MSLGLFGKLPAKGDFITRAIEPEVLAFWERWLEKSVGGAKHHLAGDWDRVYGASPVWRFWIGPGVFGYPVAGALTASVDKVGRQFPLTLVLSGMGHSHPVPPLSDPMEDWYGTLERALLAAKSAHFDGDVDGFLQSLPMPNAAPCAMGEDRRNAFFAYGEHGLGQMLADVRDHDHQLASFERSYWWTGGNEYVGPGMIAMDGMPDALGFAGMLRGFGPPARVHQPVEPPVAAAGALGPAASAAAARDDRPARETTVPPQDLISTDEEAAAAAAWGAAPADEAGEALAWAAPSDAVDDAYAAELTGEEAASPFDDPNADWSFPTKEAAPAPEPEPEPEPEVEKVEEAPEDLFDDGPEPYGMSGVAAGEDIYADISSQDDEDDGSGITGLTDEDEDNAADVEDEPEATAVDENEDDAGGEAANQAEDASAEEADEAVGEADAPAEAEEAERDGDGEAKPEDSPVKADGAEGDEAQIAEPAEADTPDDGESAPEDEPVAETDEEAGNETDENETDIETDNEAAEETLNAQADDEIAQENALPEDDESPFGAPDSNAAGLGGKRGGFRGLFSRRGRGED
ncbi:type VI secretion system-associated protein TagF [Vannielia sp.]|uniref:type VI secretion system-associated protein TagF n=1 Tax=Vannielia sp. TaxID=2813045 RepID=UPI0026378399|nr:type VI secretion system-associated protein TagF [Vannielia sp.]MDF1872450.1 type VI secretion system-associated protein TagF [Vannielia sp.]